MKVALLQVPAGDPAVAAGGSQVVALTLARQLRNVGIEVTVFCGFREGSPAPAERDLPIVRSFAVTQDCLNDGVPAIEMEKHAAARLAGCDAAFMFDRVFPIPAGVPRVLVLGTAGYSFAAEAIVSGAWHRVIVPSVYMRTELARILAEAGMSDREADIVVVPNPVRIWPRRVAAEPAASGPDRPLRLLFPHRADAKKGPDEAVALLAELQPAGRAAVLDVVVDTSETAEAGFYEHLLDEAHRVGVERQVRLVAWRPHHEMHKLFENADLTVCLGSLAEGFGLVVLESLGCGIPVVTRARGAQRELLPDLAGCFVCSPRPTTAEAARLVRSLETGELQRAARTAATRIRDLHGDRHIASAYLTATGLGLPPSGAGVDHSQPTTLEAT